MENLDKLNLPAWMMFVLATLVILIPTILEIVKQYRYNNQNKKINKVIHDLAKNQEALYKNFNMLLDVLYEKYANNLTLEVTKYVIELVYGRMANDISKHVREYIHNTDLYKDDKLDIHKIQEDILITVKNAYFNEIMILNKMTYKGITLDNHLKEQVDYETMSESICTLIAIHSSENIIKTCVQVGYKIEVYYRTLISKGKTHFDNL